MNLNLVKRVFAACFVIGMSFMAGCKQQEAKQPNIIVIFTDDQGYADLGCFGAEGFETPNIDGLAKEGIRFTDFYVPANICTPSRAGLLTGSYPKRVGLHRGVIAPFDSTGLNPEEVIIPELLKPLGYHTACIGKWHLGHLPEFMPNNQGFDYFNGVPYSNDMDRYYYKHNDFQSPALPVYENEEMIAEGTNQDSLTFRWTNEAVKYIQTHKEQPFFLYLAHNMPHAPWHASDHFKGSSEKGLYGDVIQEIDWSVGELVKALKADDLYENTIIVFTSDNGPATHKPNGGSATPLRGSKATTWEGGHRVPCIISWPKHFPKGKTCHQLSTVMDLLPTFVHLAGGQLPDDLEIDGYDMSELLFKPGEAVTPYKAFYYFARNGELEAVREGDWKLHVAKKGWDKKQGEFPVTLYNLKEDIGETNNVAEKFPEVVKRLKKLMEEKDKSLTGQMRPCGNSGQQK